MREMDLRVGVILLCIGFALGVIVEVKLVAYQPVVVITPAPTVPTGWDRKLWEDDPTILPELSNAEYIRLVYRVLLDREPDPHHLRVDNGITRWSMLYWIVTSVEFHAKLRKMRASW